MIDLDAVLSNTTQLAALTTKVAANSTALMTISAFVERNTPRLEALTRLYSDDTPEADFRVEYYRAAADGTDEEHIYYVYGPRILPFGWFEASWRADEIGTEARPGLGFRVPAQMRLADRFGDTLTRDFWYTEPDPDDPDRDVYKQREVVFTKSTDSEGREGYFAPDAYTNGGMNGSTWLLYRYRVDPWPTD